MEIEYTRNGRRRKVNTQVGNLLIKRGLARAVEIGTSEESQPVAPTYQTRMLAAAPVADPAAPYGHKADGTPRKRPAPARKAVEAD